MGRLHFVSAVAKVFQPLSARRVLSVAGLLVLLALYSYLAFRPDSSFANGTVLPWTVWKAANAVDYRNFWAFGFLGLYAAVALGVGWLPWRKGSIQWVVVGFLLIPLVKESLQNLVHGRHGTLFGGSQAFVGLWLGLMVGGACRWLWSVARAKKQDAPGQGSGPQPEGSGDRL